MVLYDEEEAEEQAKDFQQQQIFIYRLNMKDVIDNIEQGLKEETTDEGRRKLMNQLKARVLNKNIVLGNLKEQRVTDRCREIWCDVAHLISVNYYKYGIQKCSRSSVLHMIVNVAESAITRSEMGREAKQISTQTQHVEQTVREERPRQPFFGGLKKMNRREM